MRRQPELPRQARWAGWRDGREGGRVRGRRIIAAVVGLFVAGCASAPLDPSKQNPIARCKFSNYAGHTVFERVSIIGAPDPDTWEVAYPDRERFHGDLLTQKVSRSVVRPCPAGWGSGFDMAAREGVSDGAENADIRVRPRA